MGRFDAFLPPFEDFHGPLSLRDARIGHLRPFLMLHPAMGVRRAADGQFQSRAKPLDHRFGHDGLVAKVSDQPPVGQFPHVTGGGERYEQQPAPVGFKIHEKREGLREFNELSLMIQPFLRIPCLPGRPA